jgi:hypothetical protein
MIDIYLLNFVLNDIEDEYNNFIDGGAHFKVEIDNPRCLFSEGTEIKISQTYRSNWHDFTRETTRP